MPSIINKAPNLCDGHLGVHARRSYASRQPKTDNKVFLWVLSACVCDPDVRPSYRSITKIVKNTSVFPVC